MTATRTGTCTPDLFWAEVEHIGWGDKTTDCDAIKKELLGRWDSDFMRSFKELYNKLESQLYEHVSEWAHANDYFSELGEDGYGDLISHVVGLGKTAYEAGMEDPKTVVERGRAYKFEEKFSFSLPDPPRGEGLTYEEALAKVRAEHNMDGFDSEEDAELFFQMEAYELILGEKCNEEPRYYALWAKRDLPDLEELVGSQYAPHLDDLEYVHESLCKIAEGDLSPISKKLGEAAKRLREERDSIHEQALAELAVLDPRGWSIDNLVGDALKNLGE